MKVEGKVEEEKGLRVEGEKKDDLTKEEAEDKSQTQ